MQLVVDDGGWVRVWGPADPGALYVRFAQDGTGRWRPYEVSVSGGPDPVTGKMLRTLPLAAIEALLVQDDLRDELARRAHIPRIHPANDPDAEIELRRQEYAAGAGKVHIPSVSLDRLPSEQADDPPPPLVKPPGPLTDEFLQAVARSYNAVVRKGEHPAPVLAAEAGVSPRTVQSWIYTARKRGILPPGLPGRVG